MFQYGYGHIENCHTKEHAFQENRGFWQSCSEDRIPMTVLGEIIDFYLFIF